MLLFWPRVAFGEQVAAFSATARQTIDALLEAEDCDEALVLTLRVVRNSCAECRANQDQFRYAA